jgi:hypothetical protein
MFHKTLTMAAVVALAAVPAVAQTFRAENRVDVTPALNNAFQISSGGDYGARGMWCAASDYAQDVLGASGTSRIYITEPRTSTSGPVKFSLDANGTQGKSVSIVGASLRQLGANLSVDHAYQFCYDARITNSR